MATTDININPRTEELKTEFSNMIWKMATNLVHGGKVNPVQFMDYTPGRSLLPIHFREHHRLLQPADA